MFHRLVAPRIANGFTYSHYFISQTTLCQYVSTLKREGQVKLLRSHGAKNVVKIREKGVKNTFASNEIKIQQEASDETEIRKSKRRIFREITPDRNLLQHLDSIKLGYLPTRRCNRTNLIMNYV